MTPPMMIVTYLELEVILEAHSLEEDLLKCRDTQVSNVGMINDKIDHETDEWHADN
jgi:hypothetical protein